MAAELPPPAPHGVDFEKEVRPIFERACFKCHGAEKQKSGYRLDDRRVALTGGDHHAPNIVVGKSAESPLIRFVAGLEPDMQMPAKGDALTAFEIGVLRAWIDQGAVWPASGKNASADPLDWWSLRALTPQPVPAPTGNPIDAFIRARLARENLRPSPEADARTVIRRIYFDLIGLPPVAGETERFIAEYRSASAARRDALLAEVVDRLLASPRYGERWARHWLDVVHYGDTHGYDKDKPRPNAWPYRDYVIRALNTDKPYARFVEEQIAGDALFPGNEDGITALGFIAAGPWDFIGHAELSESKVDGKIARLLDRDDMVANTMNTFCALTVQCARCHNHKFDPVKQEDYYRLQAVFAALDRTDKAYDTDPAVARRRSELQEEKSTLAERKQSIEKRLAKSSGKKGELLNKPALEGERDALEKELGRTESGDRVAGEPAGELPRIVARLAKLDAELQTLPPPKVVYAGVVHHGTGSFLGTGPHGGKPRPVHVLKRGDVRQPLREVGAGTVPFIPGWSATFDLPPEHSESDRRVALARWITDRRNPLTWRVIVNRVWHYHFGRGLVDSPNDFGRMGEQPTHPELLDWLALKFRDEGQSLKELHRLIVTSATYRQSSASIPEFEKHDAGNALLWRMNRRKLEAEAVRDSMLAVAGKLDLTMGGPGFHDFSIEKPEHSPHYRYDLHDANDPKSHRRAIYRFVVRSQPQPFMTVLDCADPSMAVEKRNESVNALQALALRNSALSIAMAQQFATRVTQMAVDPAQQLEAAFRLALSRSPNEEERVPLSAYAREHGMVNACRLIFNLNEFVFID